MMSPHHAPTERKRPLSDAMPIVSTLRQSTGVRIASCGAKPWRVNFVASRSRKGRDDACSLGSKGSYMESYKGRDDACSLGSYKGSYMESYKGRDDACSLPGAGGAGVGAGRSVRVLVGSVGWDPVGWDRLVGIGWLDQTGRRRQLRGGGGGGGWR